VARRIGLIGFDEMQILDLVGPMEVFALADRCQRRERGAAAYRVELLATRRGQLTASNGLVVQATTALATVRGRFDTILVAGGQGTAAAARDRRLLGWLRRHGPRARRLGSVCSGAFVLAAAGLLDGRRATTHWSECRRLARLFPRVTVESDPIFVRDGSLVTSAGVTAGMDLALALVEEDLGRDVALEVARWMVLYVQRPGGQSQFSAQLRAQAAERSPLRDVQAWMAEHPAADLSVPALATRAGMSPRHFARVFQRELGATPAAYANGVRIEVARRLLETTVLGLDGVAERAGFGTVETLRRSFHRALGVAPSDYRARFRRAS
jgi:transcriptional regulator GlxA family with amidase domain